MALIIPPFAVTGIGSLPYKELNPAFELIRNKAPLLPFVPQLPQRDPGELMVPSLLARYFPSEVPAPVGGIYNITPEQARNFLGTLVEQNLRMDHQSPGLQPSSRPGLFSELERQSNLGRLALELQNGSLNQAAAVKLQIAGPITAAGAFLCDSVNLATDYGFLAEVAAVVLRSAVEQVALLRKSTDLPITIWLDEPLLEQFIGRSDRHLLHAGLELLKELIGSIRSAGSYVGLHCCSFPQLTQLAGLEPDIVSIDAWNGLARLFDGSSEKALIDSDIILALGIVPTSAELNSLTVEELEEKLNRLLFDRYSRRFLQHRVILTPSCGLGLNSEDEAGRAFDLLDQLRCSLLN